MRPIRIAVWLLIALAAAPSADGQWGDLYTKVLLPVVAPVPIPGAFGSSWITDSWLRNEASGPVHVFGFERGGGCIFLPECPVSEVAPISPETTIYPRVGSPSGFQGAFLFVERQKADQIAFGLRFRDLSRQSQTWGTEIPVVREGEFRTDRVSLIDVPVTPGFRQVIRVYDFDGLQERETRVRVRIFRIDTSNWTTDINPPPDRLLGEAILQLSFVPATFAREFYPAFLAVSDLSAIAPLGDAQRIAVEIVPVSPGLRLWAFATVVNNETQHATVITPQ